ncbi:hypothetical protein BDV26DRAFT_284485 [Aspergillus bertholletiae]|uniref:Uncharacterized protein n=1 Tax=Aspergillus bertholletiae TaxID=1226010 RepID=A0A5N7AZ96_9EURO|nr:hypothetical protein BDV26DRAFT_284485 [Aspergillus bertholletiae]
MFAWSPALPAVEYRWLTYQNDFSTKSDYRGPPTPHIEMLWEELYKHNYFTIPPSRLHDLDQPDHGNWVQSSGEVIANLEVYHQLACLNLLRQHTYRDEYDYSALPAFAGTEDQIMVRADRCIDTLRVALMCAGDATPYLIKIVPDRPLGEGPDFNTLHQCRDFGRIKEWSDRHGDNSLRYVEGLSFGA